MVRSQQKRGSRNYGDTRDKDERLLIWKNREKLSLEKDVKIQESKYQGCILQ